MLLAVVLLVGVTAGVAADRLLDVVVARPDAETVLRAQRVDRVVSPGARDDARVNRSWVRCSARRSETARQALQRAFAVARARAAPPKQPPDATSRPQAQQRLGRCPAGLEASTRRGTARVAGARAQRPPPAAGGAGRARLQVMTQLQGFNASMAGGAQADLSSRSTRSSNRRRSCRLAAAAEPAATLVPAAGGRGADASSSRLIACTGAAQAWTT